MSLFTTPSILDRLDRIEFQLSRIAGAVERAFPPIDEARLSIMQKRGPEAIIRYGREDKEWATEQFQEIISGKGLAPDLSRQILAETLAQWEKTAPDDQEGG